LESENVRYQNKCPDCGGVMSKGYVVGSNVLWFTKKEPNVAVTAKDGNIKLASKIWGWAHVNAQRCANCGLITIRSVE
jgi:ribosomal protein S27AE